jgi:putative membrane protein
MDHDFSKPQKQSAAGIIVMFADTLQKVIRAAALPILFIFIKSGGQHTWAVVSGGIALILILAVFAYIRYINSLFSWMRTSRNLSSIKGFSAGPR